MFLRYRLRIKQLNSTNSLFLGNFHIAFYISDYYVKDAKRFYNKTVVDDFCDFVINIILEYYPILLKLQPNIFYLG